MDQMIRRNHRTVDDVLRSVDFVNFEAVEGDILEFGVFGGVSLALLAKAHTLTLKE